MALVVHEDKIKVLLNEKLYIIEGIETMIYTFLSYTKIVDYDKTVYHDEIVYYDGVDIKKFDGIKNIIDSTPEPGLINICPLNSGNILLIYSDKIILSPKYDFDTQVYNICISNMAYLRLMRGYLVIHEPGCTRLLNLANSTVINIDHCINYLFIQEDILCYNRLADQLCICTYNLANDKTTSEIINCPIIKFMDYEIVANVIYYDKQYISHIHDMENLEYIEHNYHNILIRYSDKTIIRILSRSVYREFDSVISEDIKLYHRRTGLNTKSARKI